MFPDPVAVKVTFKPFAGLLKASRSVTVMVEEATPFARRLPGAATMLEFATVGVPAIKETVPPTLLMGAVMVRVLVSAFVDFTVQVETPDASVTLHAV